MVARPSGVLNRHRGFQSICLPNPVYLNLQPKLAHSVKIYQKLLVNCGFHPSYPQSHIQCTQCTSKIYTHTMSQCTSIDIFLVFLFYVFFFILLQG